MRAGERFCVRQSLPTVVQHRPKESGRIRTARLETTASAAEKEKQWRVVATSTYQHTYLPSYLATYLPIYLSTARFSIIRIYGNSVHVTPDNFRNGLLDESFTPRAETYPDKLHRANRQCSQMEPEARRLFKQE